MFFQGNCCIFLFILRLNKGKNCVSLPISSALPSREKRKNVKLRCVSDLHVYLSTNKGNLCIFTRLSYFFLFSYNIPQRNKRRWTVCPMEVQNQPALQLSLPSSFVQTNKRLKSNDKDGEPTCLDSADFHTDRLDRFFCEMSEREEDIEEFVPNAKDVSIRR